MTHACVVGAGIVGLSTALYLQQSGREVSLVDRLPPGEGTSAGNAGIISTGSVFPEAMPGIWKEIPQMLLQPLGAVSIRPAYLPRLTPWLLKFLRNSSDSAYAHATAAIAGLSSRALEMYEPLFLRAGASELIRRAGMYYVYETEKEFARALALREALTFEKAHYVAVSAKELAAIEPQLCSGLAGAIFIPGAAYTTSPLALSQCFFQLFVAQGGKFVQAEVSGFEKTKHRVVAVEADQKISADEVFITAGAYSKTLARALGSNVPLDTERGYHLMLPNPEIELQSSFLFTERGLGVTPMQDGLRLAGTVEFGGLDAAHNYRRAEILGVHGKQLLPQLNLDGGRPWMGYRPSLPDSIPVISDSPHYSNVHYGFGHGHLGLTQAAITGAMLAALADGKETVVDSEPYRIDRAW